MLDTLSTIVAGLAAFAIVVAMGWKPR